MRPQRLRPGQARPVPTMGRAIAALLGVVGSTALAQDARVEARTSWFHESRGPLRASAISPAVTADVEVVPSVSVNAQWEADVVSAATIAIVDSPADVDVITSATRMEDVRHALGAGLMVQHGGLELRGGYTYGFERDYRSHGVVLSTRLDVRDDTTSFELMYAGARDAVCGLRENDALEPTERGRLPGADGCFTRDAERTTRGVSTQTVAAQWIQVIRADAIARINVSLRHEAGFLSSPYREVWLGPWSAQEHHPDQRSRGALGVELRWALADIRSVIGGRIDASHDDWGVSSVSGEITWRARLPAHLRLRARVRAYRQVSAFFYSDDYANAPRGKYFTGDRELSAMCSWLGGLGLSWERAVGSLDALRIGLSADLARADYPDFHYGNVAVPDGYWLVGSLILGGSL